LATLHFLKNEFPKAEAAYTEVLNIYQALAEINQQTYLPTVAITAMNLSLFYLQGIP